MKMGLHSTSPGFNTMGYIRIIKKHCIYKHKLYIKYERGIKKEENNAQTYTYKNRDNTYKNKHYYNFN